MESSSQVREEDAPPRHRFAPELLIMLRRNGTVAVYTPPLSPPFPVGLPELTLLATLAEDPAGVTQEHIRSRIAEVAERFDVPESAMRKSLQRLRYMHLFGALPAPPASLDELAPAPPAADVARSPLELDGWWGVRVPLVLRLHRGFYEFVGHDGRIRARLTPVQTLALESLVGPTRRATAWEDHRAKAGAHALSADAFDALVVELHRNSLLAQLPAPSPGPKPRHGMVDRRFLERHFQASALAQDAEEQAWEELHGRRRVRVVPVAFDMSPPLGLGLVMAYAGAYEEGRLNEHYTFRHDWVWAPDRGEVFTKEPAVYLFSNYLWSHAQCIEVSAQVKAASPTSVTIHGGPDTPGYRHEVERYFRDNPHVDVAVHGEGEVTTAEILSRLVGALEGGGPVDLSVLDDVPGLSYRSGEAVVHTGERERVKDVDAIPSPMLSGMFDAFRGVPSLNVTIETNRGCPYGCTFCDWGGATMQRIRKFDLQRVFEELRWASEAGATTLGLSDANFGIFDRDVEIAEEVARLRGATGMPSAFGASYAKNSVANLKKIIDVLTEAKLVAQGVLAFQTADPETLKTVRRSNIKKEKYEQLATEMRAARLPLVVELMLGLPGSSVASFKEDLQECIDRDVTVRINTTTVLPNSPMNAPSYRAEHGIQVSAEPTPGKQALVVATNTFTHDDHGVMVRLRQMFMLTEHFGVFRLVARFVRQEIGIREVDLLERLIRGRAALTPYPMLNVFVAQGEGLMAPPLSWALLLDDLHRYLVTELDVPDDSALQAILTAQRAVLPAVDRRFPEVVRLQHDVVAWHEAVLKEKASADFATWPERVPRLADFGPGELAVSDPTEVSWQYLGVPQYYSGVGVHWELETPLARWWKASKLDLPA